MRAQLRSFYDAHFHLLDVGVALPLATDEAAQDAPPSLLRRFTVPDVLVRDTIADEQRAPQPDNVSAGVRSRLRLGQVPRRGSREPGGATMSGGRRWPIGSQTACTLPLLARLEAERVRFSDASPLIC